MGFNVWLKYVWDVRFLGETEKLGKVEKYSSLPVSFPIAIILVFD